MEARDDARPAGDQQERAAERGFPDEVPTDRPTQLQAVRATTTVSYRNGDTSPVGDALDGPSRPRRRRTRSNSCARRCSHPRPSAAGRRAGRRDDRGGPDVQRERADGGRLVAEGDRVPQPPGDRSGPRRFVLVAAVGLFEPGVAPVVISEQFQNPASSSWPGPGSRGPSCAVPEVGEAPRVGPGHRVPGASNTPSFW